MWACNDDCAAEFPSGESQFLDYGDAPDPTFPSLKSSNGAGHVNTEYEWLGLDVNKESDSLQINADNKDDGVTISNLYSLPPCSQTVLPVIVSVKSRDDPAHVYGNGKLLYLNMLFDWDLSGKWQGAIFCGFPPGFSAPEHAVLNYPIDVSSWPQDATTQTVIVPLKTGQITQNIWVRATLSYDQTVGFPWNGTGKFSFGETEDYGPPSSTEPPPNLVRPSADKGANASQETYELPLPEKSEDAGAIQKIFELLMPKDPDGSACQNNYECKSNICTNGICAGLVEQQTAQPTITISSIVQSIANFLSDIFGGINIFQ